MTKFYSTPEGFQILKDSLEKVKVDQKSALEDLKAAQENGNDLSENVEYLEAKDRLSGFDNKLSALVEKISQTKILDIKDTPYTGKVVFGATVTLVDIDTDKELIYKIVGDEESNIKENKISYASPLGRAIIGRSEGDEITFELPSGGDREVEILKVEHK